MHAREELSVNFDEKPEYDNVDQFEQLLLQLQNFYSMGQTFPFIEVLSRIHSLALKYSLPFSEYFKEFKIYSILLKVAFIDNESIDNTTICNAIEVIAELCKNGLYAHYFVEDGIFQLLSEMYPQRNENDEICTRICFNSTNLLLVLSQHYCGDIMQAIPIERLEYIFSSDNLDIKFVRHVWQFLFSLSQFDNIVQQICHLATFSFLYQPVASNSWAIRLLAYLCQNLESAIEVKNIPLLVQVLNESLSGIDNDTYEPALMLIAQIFAFTDAPLEDLNLQFVVDHLGDEYSQYAALAFSNLCSSPQMIPILGTIDIIPMILSSLEIATFETKEMIIHSIFNCQENGVVFTDLNLLHVLEEGLDADENDDLYIVTEKIIERMAEASDECRGYVQAELLPDIDE